MYELFLWSLIMFSASDICSNLYERMLNERPSLSDALRIKVNEENLFSGVDQRLLNHSLKKGELSSYFNMTNKTLTTKVEQYNQAHSDQIEPIIIAKSNYYTRYDIASLREFIGIEQYYSAHFSSKLIGVVNHKGGTGKSSTTMTLAVGLALDLDDFQRVLVIDLDPQGSVGTTLTFNSSEQQEETFFTFIDILLRNFEGNSPVRPFLDEGHSLEDIIKAALFNTHLPNLKTLIAFPTDDRLISVFYGLDNEQQLALLTDFRDNIKPILNRYFDTILIDTPPADNAILWCLFEAVDALLVPITPKCLDLASTTNFMGTLATRLSQLPSQGKNIKWLKAAVVNHDPKSKEEKDVINRLCRSVQDRLISNYINRSEAFLEASSTGRTVLDLVLSRSKTTKTEFDKGVNSAEAFVNTFKIEMQTLNLEK